MKGDSHTSNANAGLSDEGNDSPPSLTEFGRKRRPPPQNDAKDVEDSGLFNDASSSSTAYPDAQTHTTSTNNANSRMNHGADVAIFWESAALRFPSLFMNDFGPAALLFPQPSLTTALIWRGCNEQ